MSTRKIDNIFIGQNLRDAIEAIRLNYEIPIISVGNHSPAYHFPDLPEPEAKFEQKGKEPVCFWPQFDWHVMFAKAIAKADNRIGFICVRPDERAKQLVCYRFDKNILMVHFPSLITRRISGAYCIEKSDSLINFLCSTLKKRNFLLILMGIGSSFSRNILHCLLSNPHINVPIMGYAAGDIPAIHSKTMLANLLYGNGLKDRMRFVKQAFLRAIKIRKEKHLYKALSHLWTPTTTSKEHWKEVVDCHISFAPGGYGYDESLWEPGDKMKARKELNLRIDVPAILSSSVLIPKKKIGDLIRACAIVKRDIGDLKLVISGYGEHSEKQKLREIASRSNIEQHIIFTDYVTEKNLILYYQASDVFVHLSEVEGGPGSAMQALVTNTPLVMTPVGCVGELLEISNLGSTFPVGDVSCCAQKIIETIKLDRDIETSQIAKKLYSWEARGTSMAKDIEALWLKQKGGSL